VTQTNPELSMTLTDAVGEVLANLTGLDLTYDPEMDRFRAVTRALNRALRANALEAEWSYYATTTTGGPTTAGVNVVTIPANRRPRIKGDDAVRLVDDSGATVTWAYFLPRDAITKYVDRTQGLWVASVGQDLRFSRPLTPAEAGLSVEVPTMRAPVQFELPATGETVDQAVLDQPVDFSDPDLIVARAAYYYAQTDPVMQPRVQTLEGDYKDLMYQAMERDDANTDSPYMNEFLLPVQNGIVGGGPLGHNHPHSDERRWW
jgi:hypothetical protein